MQDEPVHREGADGSGSPSRDGEFIRELRKAVEEYLAAVDAWEAAYHKYYRLTGYTDEVSNDLQAEHREYIRMRGRLEDLLPRARRLCLRHGLRDSLSGLLRIKLGQYAPQHRAASALGRSERSAATTCLLELQAVCDWECSDAPPESAQAQASSEGRSNRSWLRRVLDYFY